MKIIDIEVCATSINSIKAASKAGAKRVEICADLYSGGVTPPNSWINYAKTLVNLEVYALIRPRGGNFVYNEEEMQSMLIDIDNCATAGCNGVVIGALTPNNEIDMKQSEKLIERARKHNMGVTFHRAIDRTVNLIDSVKQVISLGCDRILTSGGKSTAIEGIDALKKMINTANGEIKIMPGAGIDEENIKTLAKELNTFEFHGSFRSITIPRWAQEKTFDKENFIAESNYEKIKKAIYNANNY